MALIPNGGKLQQRRCRSEGTEGGSRKRKEGYKCSSSTSVNYWEREESHLGYKVFSGYKVRGSEVIRKLSLLKTEERGPFYSWREPWIRSGDC